MKNHIEKYSNTLAYRKCYLKLIFSIGFQFWEPLRGALHYRNFDFLILTLFLNTLVPSPIVMFQTGIMILCY